jgi:hypothetical protein
MKPITIEKVVELLKSNCTIGDYIVNQYECDKTRKIIKYIVAGYLPRRERTMSGGNVLLYESVISLYANDKGIRRAEHKHPLVKYSECKDTQHFIHKLLTKLRKEFGINEVF